MIYLIDITGLPPGTSTPRVLRFVAGEPLFRTRPDEEPPNAVWRPGVLEPMHFTREMFGGDDAGASRIGAGVIELANSGGELDRYEAEGWSFQGQPFTVRAGLYGWPVAAFRTVFKGLIRGWTPSWQKVEVPCRDMQERLDKELPIPKYLGTNSGPTGVEGLPGDIKDKPKPLCLGDCRNVEPRQVNASKLIYQVNFRSVLGIPAVYANGSGLTFDADDADETALAAATIAGGHYRTCLAKGLIRINADQAQSITCDVLGDNVGGYVDDLAGVFRRLLEIAGWSPGEWSATDLAALAAACPGKIGLHDPDGKKARELLDMAASGPWAWYCPDRLGVLRFGRVEAPAVQALATWRDDKSMELDQIEDSDLAGTPWGLVTARWGRNWRTMKDSQVAAVVSAERRAWLAEEYRLAHSTADGLADPAVLARWPYAQDFAFDTLYVNRADALAEAQRRAALRASGYRMFRQRRAFAPLRQAEAGRVHDFGWAVEPGQTYALTSRRLGLSARRAVVAGVEDVLSANYSEITLYG
jgi:hypothetical protein